MTSFTQTLSDGLKREFSVVVTAGDLAARMDKHVADVALKVRMPGFRPGKVPTNLVRKVHGEALRGQVLEEVIQEGTQKLFADTGVRPALQPKIELVTFEKDKDLEYKVSVEILPDVPPLVLEGLALEKLVVPVEEAAVEAQLERLASQQKAFEEQPEGYAAQKGDAVVIDFVGSIKGVAFEGGKGEDMQVELGSGQLIPGFEEQLIGAKVGDSVTVNVTFPTNYQAAELKGKDAVFAVTVTSVKTAKPAQVDESLATNLGLTSLEQLRELLKAQVERELAGLSRTHLKRKLLDALSQTHVFPVPASMLEAEFEQIWQQLKAEIEGDEQALAKLEAEQDDYRKIAERRVRLGLLLSDVGQKNNVQISQAEMQRLIMTEAQKYPGQQQEVVKYFQENTVAAAQLRAPLYEEKVVDFILSKITLTERTVSRADLEAAIQDEDTEASKAAAPAENAQEAQAKPPAKAKKAKATEGSTTPEASQTASDDGEIPADSSSGEAPAKPKKKAPSKKSVAQ